MKDAARRSAIDYRDSLLPLYFHSQQPRFNDSSSSLSFFFRHLVSEAQATAIVFPSAPSAAHTERDCNSRLKVRAPACNRCVPEASTDLGHRLHAERTIAYDEPGNCHSRRVWHDCQLRALRGGWEWISTGGPTDRANPLRLSTDDHIVARMSI